MKGKWKTVLWAAAVAIGAIYVLKNFGKHIPGVSHIASGL